MLYLIWEIKEEVGSFLHPPQMAYTNQLLCTVCQDFDFTSNPFTWTNGRDGRQAIFECLDKGKANGHWRFFFQHALVHHLPRYALDHAPIILNMEGGSNAGLKPFRFEQFCTKYPRSFRVIKRLGGINVKGHRVLFYVTKSSGSGRHSVGIG